MRISPLPSLALFAMAVPFSSQHADAQTAPDRAPKNTKAPGASPRQLKVEVLQTDSGVGGTNQFVYLRVFSDGSVEFHPKRNDDLRRVRVTRARISEMDLDAISKALSEESVVELPKVFATTYTPTDFYWTLDFTIPRGTQSQKIKVVNFYPTMAKQNKKTYPDALVKLVCTVWAARESFPTETPNLSGDCKGFGAQK